MPSWTPSKSLKQLQQCAPIPLATLSQQPIRIMVAHIAEEDAEEDADAAHISPRDEEAEVVAADLNPPTTDPSGALTTTYGGISVVLAMTPRPTWRTANTLPCPRTTTTITTITRVDVPQSERRKKNVTSASKLVIGNANVQPDLQSTIEKRPRARTPMSPRRVTMASDDPIGLGQPPAQRWHPARI